MQITRIQIKNFLSITDVEIKPGQVNQIVGGNNNGKTSILRAIEVGLKGSTDGSLVKHGTDGAEIIIEFDNEMAVKRRLKPDGTQKVEVRKGDMTAQAPQTFLSSLVEAGAFNPLELLDPKRRSEALLRAIDLNISEQDVLQALGGEAPIPLPPMVDYSQHGLKVAEQVHKYFYQRRAEANKDADEKVNRFRVRSAELPQAPVVSENAKRPEEDLRREIGEMQELIRAEQAKQMKLKQAEDRVRTVKAGIEILVNQKQKLELEIKMLQGRAMETQAAIDKSQADLQEASERVKEIEPDPIKIASTNARIQTLHEAINQKGLMTNHLRQVAMVEELEKEAAKAMSFAGALDKAVNALGQKFREALMTRVVLPIEGLAYRDGEFFLDGSSIDNLSSSKALKLAVALARKLASKTKLVCIDGAELLDENGYKELRSLIDGDGFTYFITKVGAAFKADGDKVVTMTDGMGA